jgi:putative two-component system response regulator
MPEMNAPSLETAAAPPPTILVVDDEPMIRDVLVRWLVAAGFRCLQADDGEAAWTTLQQQHVDLVTSDINMPGVSGMELLARVVSGYPELPVVMLTGFGGTSTAISALTQGACGYLLKPVQRQELVFQVKQGIERAQLIKERRCHLEELERRVLEQTKTIRAAYEETIHRLVTASCFRDEETGAHIRRTGLLSEALARAAGWSPAACERLRMAAPMHDVGKIAIPDVILRKPGKYTPQEFEIMKRHTTIGAQMLQGSQSPTLQLACEVALNHHERWDGRGYPNGIAGEAIPESARIVAIVDVYDALGHNRVYRPALSESEVLEVLRRGAGSHFDPALVALFFTILDEASQISRAVPDPAAGEKRLAVPPIAAAPPVDECLAPR